MVEKPSREEVETLLEAARKVREKAYAPYSGFSVGAAVLTADGKIYTGCNVENVSYGLTNCAERTAMFKAVSEGSKKFRAVAIAADTDRYCSPCGACRQVMAEFGDFFVIQSDKAGNYLINTVDELLPGSFTARLLGKETVE